MSKQTVLDFINAINQHDVNKISDLMSDNHIFIDTWNGHTNKEDMIKGWQGYFEWFPDYLIEVWEMMENYNVIAVFGFASGTYLGKKSDTNHWKIPACWRVEVDNDRIKVWQVYSDAKIPFDIMQNNQ